MAIHPSLSLSTSPPLHGSTTSPRSPGLHVSHLDAAATSPTGSRASARRGKERDSASIAKRGQVVANSSPLPGSPRAPRLESDRHQLVCCAGQARIPCPGFVGAAHPSLLADRVGEIARRYTRANRLAGDARSIRTRRGNLAHPAQADQGIHRPGQAPQAHPRTRAAPTDRNCTPSICAPEADA